MTSRAVLDEPSDDRAGKRGKEEHDRARRVAVTDEPMDANIITVVEGEREDRGDQDAHDDASYDEAGISRSMMLLRFVGHVVLLLEDGYARSSTPTRTT